LVLVLQCIFDGLDLVLSDLVLPDVGEVVLGDASLERDVMLLVDALQGKGADLGLRVLPVEQRAPLHQSEVLLSLQGCVVCEVPDVFISELALDTSLALLMVVDGFLDEVLGQACEVTDLLDGHLVSDFVVVRCRVSEPEVLDGVADGDVSRNSERVVVEHDGQLRIIFNHR